jgi:hypothetical protein
MNKRRYIRIPLPKIAPRDPSRPKSALTSKLLWVALPYLISFQTWQVKEVTALSVQIAKVEAAVAALTKQTQVANESHRSDSFTYNP